MIGRRPEGKNRSGRPAAVATGSLKLAGVLEQSDGVALLRRELLRVVGDRGVARLEGGVDPKGGAEQQPQPEHDPVQRVVERQIQLPERKDEEERKDEDEELGNRQRMQEPDGASAPLAVGGGVGACP